MGGGVKGVARMVLGVLALAGGLEWVHADPVWVPLGSDAPEPPRVRLVADLANESVVRLDISGYWREEGAAGSRFMLQGHAPTLEAGQPLVPVVVVHLRIADAGVPVVEVLESAGLDEAVPSCARAALTRRLSNGVAAVYAPAAVTGGWYPVREAEGGPPFLLRDRRGIALRLHPFQYDAARGVMRVTTGLVVRVCTGGVGGLNVRGASPRVGAASAEFEALYQRLFLNHRERATRYTHVPEAGRLLIIAADTLLDAARPLARWKRQKGIPTELVAASTVGNTYASMLAYIRAAYTNTGITHVQLVGDADQLAYPPGTKGIMDNAVATADPRYALLAGSDYYPEVVVARFAGRTVAEISNMVSRSVQYERWATTNDTWRGRGCGVGASSDLGADGLYDYQRIEAIRSVLTNYTYTLVDQIYDPGANLATLTSALNAGRGLFNYQGHGNRVVLVTPSVPRTFQTGDVLGLANVGMLPAVNIVGCRSGMFLPTDDCMADAWMKAGTASAPRGAIAVFASAHDQYLEPPTYSQRASIELLAAEAFHSVGALWFNGMMFGVSVFPHTNPDTPGTVGEELFEQSHLFGDGTLVMGTDTPAPMAVNHRGARYADEKSYAVRVVGVPGALCALYDAEADALMGAAYADGAGDAEIPITTNTSATLTLTVTAFNRVTVVTPVPYVEAPRPEGALLRIW